MFGVEKWKGSNIHNFTGNSSHDPKMLIVSDVTDVFIVYQTFQIIIV